MKFKRETAPPLPSDHAGSQHLTHFCLCACMCAFVICACGFKWTVHVFVSACKLVGWLNKLTNDKGGDLVPAGALLILDFTYESGVDSVVHLLHHQLVVLHRHRVGQRTRRSGGKENIFQILCKIGNDGVKGKKNCTICKKCGTVKSSPGLHRGRG